jgi:cobalamin biosynthetic protein CobC
MADRAIDAIGISDDGLDHHGEKGEIDEHGWLPITGIAAVKPVAHGGDLRIAQRRFPDAPRPWLDLSTGINPVAYPIPTLAAEAWARLPAAADEEALRATAARRFGVRDPATIVVAPGTQALIQLLPRLVPRSRVAVVGPTYEEHEVCWRRQGHDVTVVDDLAATAGFDVAIVVNPDNPSGRLIPPVALRAHRALLVVDEAFIDLLPIEASLARDLPDNAIVLRSFGKTYGLAGVRLGFAVARRDLAARLRDELGPWAVSGPALAVGCAALGDSAWLEQAAHRLAQDARRLDGMLLSAHFRVLGGTSLFRFAAHDDVPAMVERLGRNGIHVRAFCHLPDRLRFGMPGNEADFRRVAAALGV